MRSSRPTSCNGRTTLRERRAAHRPGERGQPDRPRPWATRSASGEAGPPVSSACAHTGRPWFTPLGQPIGGSCDGGGNIGSGETGVDDREPAWFGGRESQKPVPDATMESEVELGLEAGDIFWCDAGETVFCGKIEQDRQV